ncbi:MAG: helix-turn-helix domain-containing protein, partial [Oscillospiraceae bacterium]|nr:helix-turn-helix domain-containing protein [Oscillospiraceae bacterium]
MSPTNTTTTALADVAARIRELREIAGLTQAAAAEQTGFTLDEYKVYEAGAEDLPFSFIHKSAQLYDVDMSELLVGASTERLTHYAVTRRGAGRVTAREDGIEISELAPMFRDKFAEPYWVTYKYSEEQQSQPIALHAHEGHEFDLIISGSLKVQIGDHIEVLSEGDSIYYNSTVDHGEIAVGGADCVFCAVVLPGAPATEEFADTIKPLETKQPLIYNNFIDTVEDEIGAPLSVKFKNIDNYNFAFDVVDVLAETKPAKLAMLHVDRDFNERR